MKEAGRILFLRIAAAIVLMIGLGAGFLYIRNSTDMRNNTVIASGSDQRDVTVTLPRWKQGMAEQELQTDIPE